MSRFLRATVVAVGAVAAATASTAAAYQRYGRVPCLTWGATADEVARSLPGDDLVVEADIVATRAITIDAPAAAVWPWLVQLGPGRGGAYTYDWIENLMGLDMHSADEVLLQFQDLALDDRLSLSDKGPHMRVVALEPERTLVFASEDGHWVWGFHLDESDGSTRLISRNRIWSPDSGPVGRLVNRLVMEPGSLVMERKMLLGLQERAERLAAA
jgi:hypothetical protein